MFDRMSGIGAHEVIIETPDHDRPLALQSRSRSSGCSGVPRAGSTSRAISG
jgi:galactose-1-phosphate uridylyltransferase